MVLEAEGALLEPIRLRHFVDKQFLGFGSGLMLFDESGFEGFESGRVFAGDDQSGGGEAVLQ